MNPIQENNHLNICLPTSKKGGGFSPASDFTTGPVVVETAAPLVRCSSDFSKRTHLQLLGLLGSVTRKCPLFPSGTQTIGQLCRNHGDIKAPVRMEKRWVVPVGGGRRPPHTRWDTSVLLRPTLLLAGPWRLVAVGCWRPRVAPGTTGEKFRAAGQQTAAERSIRPPGDGRGEHPPVCKSVFLSSRWSSG